MSKYKQVEEDPLYTNPMESYSLDAANLTKRMFRYLDQSTTFTYIGRYRMSNVTILGINIVEWNLDHPWEPCRNFFRDNYPEKKSDNRLYNSPYFLWVSGYVHGPNYSIDNGDVIPLEAELRCVLQDHAYKTRSTPNSLAEALQAINDFHFLVNKCVINPGGYIIEEINPRVVEYEHYGKTEHKFELDAVAYSKVDDDGFPKDRSTKSLRELLSTRDLLIKRFN